MVTEQLMNLGNNRNYFQKITENYNQSVTLILTQHVYIVSIVSTVSYSVLYVDWAKSPWFARAKKKSS